MNVLTHILALALVTIVPTAACAQTAEAFQREQAAQKNREEILLGQCPVVYKTHPSVAATDLLSLHVERGDLVLRTAMPTIPQLGRVKIGASDAWAMISIVGGSPGDGKAVIPSIFMLNRVTFSPKQTEAISVQLSPGIDLIITEQIQTPTGDRSVALQEQFPNPLTKAPGICQITLTNFARGQPIAPVMWKSDNFAALTLEHAGEVDKYLRPLLGEIDQGQVLAPDQMLAFELFSDQWMPDAAMTAKVNSLVAGLAGGDFHSRAHAEHDLAALGKDAALALIHMDRTQLDAEQNARIDKLLAPYRPVPKKEAAKLGSTPGFLANCLYSDDIEIRKAAFARLLAVTKRPLKFDPAAPAAQRSAELAPLLDRVAAVSSNTTKP